MQQFLLSFWIKIKLDVSSQILLQQKIPFPEVIQILSGFLGSITTLVPQLIDFPRIQSYPFLFIGREINISSSLLPGVILVHVLFPSKDLKKLSPDANVLGHIPLNTIDLPIYQ